MKKIISNYQKIEKIKEIKKDLILSLYKDRKGFEKSINPTLVSIEWEEKFYDNENKLLSLIEDYNKAQKELFLDQLYIKERNGLKLYSNLVIVDGEKILILKRCDCCEIEPLKWCIPGGHIENDELPKETAIRETEEETGIKIKNYIDVDESLTIPIKDDLGITKGIIFYYLTSKNNCYFDNIVLSTDEHDNYNWVDIDNLDNYDFIFDTVNHIKEILGLSENNLQEEI